MRNLVLFRSSVVSMLLSSVLLSACGSSNTTGGIPKSCVESGTPYLRYAAFEIRGNVAFTSGYSPSNGSSEDSIANEMIQTHVRMANSSMQTWILTNDNCNVNAIADFVSALNDLDTSPFSSADLDGLKILQQSGNSMSDALGLNISFSPPSPTSDSSDPDPANRPSAVQGKYHSYDSNMTKSFIDLANAS